MANVMPAWLGAISAWLLKWPDELHALNPSDKDTKLKKKEFHFVLITMTTDKKSMID